MRQVFASDRLETVEGVVRLLKDNGIDAIVRNGRGYRGNRRQNFSYRQSASNLPEAWVLNNDDKTRARQLLFDAKLIDSTRDRDSYLAGTQRRDDERQRKGGRAMTLRLVALGLLTVGAGIFFMTRTQSPLDRADTALQGTIDAAKSRPIPLSLQISALQQGIDLGAMPALCLSVDGQRPVNDLMARLQGNGKRIVPFNHCERKTDPQTGSQLTDGTPAEFIEVGNFRARSATDGVIDINTYHHQQWAHYRTYRVELVNGRWVVRQLTRHVAA